MLISGVVAAAESDTVELFDGRSLEGWRAAENPGSFRVVDGAILCDGPRAHLFYEGPGGGAGFKNFELNVEVKTRRGANSGVFFHTRYQEKGWPEHGFEVQVNNSQEAHEGYLELKKTGSLYGVRNLHKALVADNEWFALRIGVRGRRVEVCLNDRLVVDYREPEAELRTSAGPVPRLGRGTFALQCHDPGSRVSYRHIRVRRLPDETPDDRPAPEADVVDRQILELAASNFPVIDLHGHLKGGLTIEDVLAHSRRTGINYGIAVNGGVGFPMTNDAGALEFLESMKGQPVFIALQAEGREWVRLFSRAAIARFDYVFTDAMTFTDHRGKRTRLWIPSEVEVDEPEAFVERLVGTIERILTEEPIDIYVNPTYLPDAIAADYDRLWTPARMQRVIDAAKRNGVAIEINARFRLPSERFIRMAKQAGVKFTFGTNNGDRELGRLEYCLEMQRACGLQWQDMYVPGTPRARRPSADH